MPKSLHEILTFLAKIVNLTIALKFKHLLRLLTFNKFFGIAWSKKIV